MYNTVDILSLIYLAEIIIGLSVNFLSQLYIARLISIQLYVLLVCPPANITETFQTYNNDIARIAMIANDESFLLKTIK